MAGDGSVDFQEKVRAFVAIYYYNYYCNIVVVKTN